MSKRIPSPRELELLYFVNFVYDVRREMPTFEEIANFLGISSRGSVGTMINSLVSKGYLRRKKVAGHRSRIVITEKGKIDEEPFYLCPTCGRIVKNKDYLTWRIVKKLMKAVQREDEIGFTIDGEHWVLKKGDFS